MTNEEAITALKWKVEYAKEIGEPYTDCVNVEALALAVKALEADRWIPVSERLPEEMGTYLVTLEYKEHGKGITTLWYHGKQIGWDLRVADVVIAWKPLPKPYTESEV